MRGLFLVGYFGFNNFGDEILKQLFVEHFTGQPIYVLSTSTRTENDLRYIKRFSLKDLWAAFMHTDRMLFAGGGILQSSTSSLSLFYYLALIVVAVILRKKVVLAFQGIGPFRSVFDARITATIIHYLVDYVSVRDQGSRQTLAQAGCARPIQVYPDPSVAYFAEKLSTPQQPRARTLGVNLRTANLTDTSLINLAETLNTICLEQAYRIKFYILQTEQEAHLVHRIAQFLTVEYEMCHLTAANFMQVFDCDRLLAMRLHLLVLAYSIGVPALGLSYDPKVQSFINRVEIPELDLKLQDLDSKLRALLTSPARLAPGLDEELKAIRQGMSALDNVI